MASFVDSFWAAVFGDAVAERMASLRGLGVSGSLMYGKQRVFVLRTRAGFRTFFKSHNLFFTSFTFLYTQKAAPKPFSARCVSSSDARFSIYGPLPLPFPFAVHLSNAYRYHRIVRH
jgi:hypothetical protein